MREMRLKKREITDPEILREFLESCEVVRIGAMDEEGMFIVPMNYGYDVWEEDGTLHAKSGWTDIFIYPGYKFKVIDGLITNFHLPESTLLMLVSALAGREHILNAYNIAVKERYRFFSFGDAMFIHP